MASFLRLDALEKNDSIEGFRTLQQTDMEHQSMFLAQFLKFVVSAPKQTLLSKKKGKWDKAERAKLKQFVSDHRGLTAGSFQPLGLVSISVFFVCVVKNHGVLGSFMIFQALLSVV